MTDQPDVKEFYAQRVAEFRANGGKLNPPLDTVLLLVLTTTAAKSGQPHPTPMSYTTDHDRWRARRSRRGGGRRTPPSGVVSQSGRQSRGNGRGRGRDVPGACHRRDRAGAVADFRPARRAAAQLRRFSAAHDAATAGCGAGTERLTNLSPGSSPTQGEVTRCSRDRLCAARRKGI